MSSTDARDDWRTEEFDDLCAALLTMLTTDEIARFLRDLCTYREIEELTSRWRAVRLLESGVSYRTIAEQTGTSTATITRVNQWRQHGLGGYRLAMDRLGGGADA